MMLLENSKINKSKMTYKSSILNIEYFVSLALHNALILGSLNNINLYKKNFLIKGDIGIYLVVFNGLKKDSNILIYNYIYYTDIFRFIWYY